METPVLFVHGIKGGHLRDASGRRWVGAWQALGLDRRPLSAPLEWDDMGQGRDGMRSDGPIERVLWVQVYGPFLAHMRRLCSTTANSSTRPSPG